MQVKCKVVRCRSNKPINRRTQGQRYYLITQGVSIFFHKKVEECQGFRLLDEVDASGTGGRQKRFIETLNPFGSQVLLRWLLQQRVAVLPRSRSLEHIRENSGFQWLSAFYRENSE